MELQQNVARRMSLRAVLRSSCNHHNSTAAIHSRGRQTLVNFFGLATDYDGTLAYSGRVRETTIQALERLRDSGRRLLLVTGRQLPELLDIFPRSDFFEWIVAEDGVLLYCPGNREMRLLAETVLQNSRDIAPTGRR